MIPIKTIHWRSPTGRKKKNIIGFINIIKDKIKSIATCWEQCFLFIPNSVESKSIPGYFIIRYQISKSRTTDCI